MLLPRLVVPTAESLASTRERCEAAAADPQFGDRANWLRLGSLVASYSLGAPRVELRLGWEHWLASLKTGGTVLGLARDDYVAAIWLVSLGRLLAPNQLESVDDRIEDLEGDALLTALRQGRRPTSEDCRHPPFLDIVRAASSRPERARPLLANALAGYPTSVGNLPWRLLSDLEIEPAGCWSFESAVLFANDEAVLPHVLGSTSLPADLAASELES